MNHPTGWKATLINQAASFLILKSEEEVSWQSAQAEKLWES